MEKFVVSARKYRPDTFDTVVGQGSITTTLKNAIKTGHLAHAYLFCGPRGIGKTTCARIFAKTINCFNIQENIEACNECVSCKSFNESRSYNIHELDAASNNSVDDIRNLIEQVRIPPQMGKYNIYIIDEVHMLSQAAFNAFLKTLEEPPSHAVFILATTEKHKIIPTILSRCQIFDFSRITIDDIVGHLESIAKKESISFERDGLNVIAQKADGGMRDALSIFDQIASFSNNTISYKEVIENLNVLDYDYYFKLTDAFLTGDTVSSLLIFDKILKEGFDGHNFINGLAHHFRDLLVCKDEQTLKLLEVGENIRKQYREQSVRTGTDFIFEALQVCNSCDLSYKSSKNQRLHVELALLKLSNLIVEKKNSITNQVKATPLVEKKVEVVKEVTFNNNVSEKRAEPVGVLTEDVAEKKVTENKFDHSKNTTFNIPGSVSIMDALNKLERVETVEEPVAEFNDKKEEVPLTESIIEKNGFTKDELINCWNKYTEGIKDEMPRMYSTLKTNLPDLKENTIQLNLNNQTQVDDFNQRVRSGLLSYLKSNLKNSLIEINLVLNEENQVNGKKPYTAEDKFKHMLQKNPVLGRLKQEFNLDFE